MSMRSKYVAPGASVYYFVVEWEPTRLSWADFRGAVLGPTDPTTAPAGSLRGNFYRHWERLRLARAPDVGDNAVHASASPFEALAEQCNWLGARPEELDFGRKLLEIMDAEMLLEWSRDPQVTYGSPPTTKSVFDAVEDTDANECLALLGAMYAQRGAKERQAEEVREAPAAPAKQSAFVFVKPHANTERACEYTRSVLGERGLTITREGLITAEEIDSKQLIDNHYYAIASKATILTPDQLNVPKQMFSEKFSADWDETMKAGRIYNAKGACEYFGLDS